VGGREKFQKQKKKRKLGGGKGEKKFQKKKTKIRAEEGQTKRVNPKWHMDRKENPTSAPSIQVGGLCRWPKCYHVLNRFFLPEPGFLEFIRIFNGINHF
jgi:hypothetical protein